jgi:hypothetical protein
MTIFAGAPLVGVGYIFLSNNNAGAKGGGNPAAVMREPDVAPS